MGGHLTKMADVYSFGVLVLEIISGRSSARADWGGSGKLLLEWVCSESSIMSYDSFQLDNMRP